ncbi:MAG: hypothetical protein AMXMBFR4_29010 [Candidatus Hydrogenedentota bacterium]
MWVLAALTACTAVARLGGFVGGDAADSVADPPLWIRALINAYPSASLTWRPPDQLIWGDGTHMAVGMTRSYRPYNERLSAATLWDQMSIPYPPGWPYPTPGENEDPGRLRCYSFFRKLYGDSPEEVRRNLKRIPWLPGGKNCFITFTAVNGAAEALYRAGEEIARLPNDARALGGDPKGTYVWRRIEGTDRLSMHSFGAAIDFRMPGISPPYWRWTTTKPGEPITYPESIQKNEQLRQVVGIFEKYGFIWGGKWYHFDFMHFEYRPELLYAEK